MILQGNCLEELKKLEDNSVDVLVTDPPYALQFMNKSWDKALPSIEVWKECLRVMKPGSFGFVMCAPRQDCLSQMIVRLDEAGFNTNFTSIYWTYASGFPKAHNISKTIDKRLNGLNTQDYAVISKEKPEVNRYDESDRYVIDYTKGVAVPPEEKENGTGGISRGAAGVKQVPAWIPVYGREVIGKYKVGGNALTPWQDKAGKLYATGSPNSPSGNLNITAPATDQAKQFDGSYGGFQPKPAVEVIIVVMKPMTEPTFVGQAIDNAKGVTWLDDCRIPYASDGDKESSQPGGRITGGIQKFAKSGSPELDGIVKKCPEQGRFPANLLVSDDVLDTGKISKDGVAVRRNGNNGKGLFPVKIKEGSMDVGYGGEGTFSRFFSLDAWAEKNLPFLIVPKASKREKNNGCDDFEEKEASKQFMLGMNNVEHNDGYIRSNKPIKMKNNHPTVKPIKLMSYLITMGSRKGEVVLDPFAGSMSTGCACVLGGRKYIMIEQEAEYVEIGKARLKYYEDRKVEELF